MQFNGPTLVRFYGGCRKMAKNKQKIEKSLIAVKLPHNCFNVHKMTKYACLMSFNLIRAQKVQNWGTSILRKFLKSGIFKKFQFFPSYPGSIETIAILAPMVNILAGSPPPPGGKK